MAIVVGHCEITGQQWNVFLTIDQLDTFLATGNRSMVIPAHDLALEMAPYEEPPPQEPKPKTPWTLEVSIR